VVKSVSLDTGPISLYFTKNHSKNIDLLFNSIKRKQTNAFIIAPVLSEVFKHLCVANGKDFANSAIISLLKSFPIQVVSLNQSLILKAGELKCQFRKDLSYIDCFVIALALLQKYEIHTTEKSLPSISHLKIVTYSF
jgi:predicted nucleic acid-binding protein